MKYIKDRTAMTKKDKKHSGRYTPFIVDVTMKYEDIKLQALEPSEEYDDYAERRDGYRDYESKKRKDREIEKEKRRLQ